ncbi:MAG: hypothetical protein J5524_05190 [Bacteroidaceae bacterium]|nr:hypothetical protein [Bacteroidaceae bacterium]
MKLFDIINDGEKYTSSRLLMMAAWVSSPIFYYLNIFFSKKSFLGIQGSFVVPTVFILLVLLSFHELKHKINKWGFFVYFLFLIAYIATYVFYPLNSQYLDKEFSQFFFRVLPFIFVGLLLDINKFQNSFTILSILSIGIHALYQFWYAKQIVARTGLMEDMVGAYMILPHVLYLIWSAIRSRKLLIIVISVLSTFFLLSLGNRGCIVCLAVFFILFLIASDSYKGMKFTKFLVLILGLIIVVKSQQISLFLSDYLKELGMSNRVLEMMLSDEFLVSHGRDSIRQSLVDAILNGPFLGYGLCGDRVVSGAIYAHNFFLEVFADFGILIGSILIIGFIFICIYAFHICRTSEEKYFLIILIATFMGLMFSGSFLEDSQWAFLLGFSMRMIKQNKSKRIIPLHPINYSTN